MLAIEDRYFSKNLFHSFDNVGVMNPDDSPSEDFPTKHLNQTLNHMEHSQVKIDQKQHVWKSNEKQIIEFVFWGIEKFLEVFIDIPNLFFSAQVNILLTMQLKGRNRYVSELLQYKLILMSSWL